jgi:hypothetical protein
LARLLGRVSQLSSSDSLTFGGEVGFLPPPVIENR